MGTTVTNAPGVFILDVKPNESTASGGSTSTGGTVVQSKKGQIGKVLDIRESNRKALLGSPFSKKVGTKMEGIRQVA